MPKNIYFVYVQTNGIIHAQKWYGEQIKAEIGKEYPYVKKIKLTEDERLLTISELEKKYPLENVEGITKNVEKSQVEQT